jgi:hypothetical protein
MPAWGGASFQGSEHEPSARDACEALGVTVSSDTLGLLRWHAGLDGDPLDAASVSGSANSGLGVPASVDAFVQVRERLNHELNGSRPSEDLGFAQGDVPRDAAYAVAEVTRMLRAVGQAEAAAEIDVAWSGVLAGDIDDVVLHLAQERAALSD